MIKVGEGLLLAGVAMLPVAAIAGGVIVDALPVVWALAIMAGAAAKKVAA